MTSPKRKGGKKKKKSLLDFCLKVAQGAEHKTAPCYTFKVPKQGIHLLASSKYAEGKVYYIILGAYLISQATGPRWERDWMAISYRRMVSIDGVGTYIDISLPSEPKAFEAVGIVIF